MSESFGQSFEYDEDTEGDEAFEADEASDEADEAFEADEASDEADEAFEADEASDEADESREADEASDEADEGIDEAMSAGARLQARAAADRDASRRRRWAARLASDRKSEARAASAVQQSLTSRLQSIRGSGQSRAMTVGNLNGVRTVEMKLANGRIARVQVLPALASASEVNRLRSVLNNNERRRAASDATNSRAISRLATTQANFVKRQTAQQVNSDRELGKRIVEGDARLDKRITNEVANQKTNIEKNNKRIFKHMKRMRFQLLMNDVLIASALPMFAAYGKTGDPFDKRNLALTGILGGFLVGDELIGMATGMGKYSKGMNSLSTVWSTVAPLGNGLADFLLFDKTQNERFLSGVSKIAATESTITVEVPIAEKSLDDFKKLIDPPVVATIVSGIGTAKADVGSNPAVAVTTAPAIVTASVKDGKLTLTLNAPATAEVKIAWVIDTDPDANAANS